MITCLRIGVLLSLRRIKGLRALWAIVPPWTGFWLKPSSWKLFAPTTGLAKFPRSVYAVNVCGLKLCFWRWGVCGSQNLLILWNSRFFLVDFVYLLVCSESPPPDSIQPLTCELDAFRPGDFPKILLLFWSLLVESAVVVLFTYLLRTSPRLWVEFWIVTF